MVRRTKLVSWSRLLATNNSPSLLPRLKFDDDRVTPATLKEVLEENYGGEPQGAQALNTRPNLRTMKRFTNAYMLVYMRECMMDEILNDVTTADIPPHLSKLCIVC
jgi:ubiquitin carboxyl-terminal hydrolase 7